MPHWDTISPSEKKLIDAKAKKWVVVRYAIRNIANSPVEQWVTEALEDGAGIRFIVEKYNSKAVILMEKLREHDARMWANMMK